MPASVSTSGARKRERGLATWKKRIKEPLCRLKGQTNGTAPILRNGPNGERHCSGSASRGYFLGEPRSRRGHRDQKKAAGCRCFQRCRQQAVSSGHGCSPDLSKSFGG